MDSGDTFSIAVQIATSLLGDPRAAAEVAAAAEVRHSFANPTPWPVVLAPVAHDVVQDCLQRHTGTAAPGDGEDHQEANLRDSVRRRLQSCNEQEQIACALHRLGGVDRTLTSEAMEISPQQVDRLCVPLSLGPEVSYTELTNTELTNTESPETDPAETEPAETEPAETEPAKTGLTKTGSTKIGADQTRTVRRKRPRKSLMPVIVAVTLLAVVSIALLARCNGDRPTFDSVDSDFGTVISADAAAIPSAGCADPIPPPDDDDGSAELVEPTPKPMIVSLPGYGQTADELAGIAGWAFLQDEGEVLVIGIDPAPDESEFNTLGDPNRRDDRSEVVARTEDAITHECVDLARIHLVGYGSGGQLAGGIACTNAALYASVTMVSGWMMPDTCELDPPVSAMFMANSGDPVISIAGGYGPEAESVWADPTLRRADPEPLANVASRWAEAIDTETLPEIPDPGTGLGEDQGNVDPSGDQGTAAVHESWTAATGAEVTVAINPSGSHEWYPDNNGTILEFMVAHARN